MRKAIFVVVICLISAGIIFNLSACKKSEGNPPSVTLKSNLGYVSQDTILTHGTEFTFWVYVTKMAADDLVETGKIQRSVNGGPDSTLLEMSFVTTQFSEIYTYQAPDSGSYHTYTFTFGNQNGLTSTKRVSIIGI